MSSKTKYMSDVLEALLEGILKAESTALRMERKIDGLADSQLRLEQAAGELSREVNNLREGLNDERRRRAGLGRTVLEHDVDLSLIKGGRSD